jgi:hypothetical protein
MSRREIAVTNKSASLQFGSQFVVALSIALSIVAALLFAGCGVQANPARPVEEQQIENVVEEYYVRNGSIPEYEATIEEVDGTWARVRIAPVGVDTLGGGDIIYLQNQDQTPADVPPPTLAVAPGNQAQVTTTSGWTIVTGPQAQFTDEELDAAGVPESIRG